MAASAAQAGADATAQKERVEHDVKAARHLAKQLEHKREAAFHKTARSVIKVRACANARLSMSAAVVRSVPSPLGAARTDPLRCAALRCAVRATCAPGNAAAASGDHSARGKARLCRGARTAGRGL
jgi:hypothetical protein